MYSLKLSTGKPQDIFMILPTNVNSFFNSLWHQIPIVEENPKYVWFYCIEVRSWQKVISGTSAIVLPDRYVQWGRPPRGYRWTAFVKLLILHQWDCSFKASFSYIENQSSKEGEKEAFSLEDSRTAVVGRDVFGEFRSSQADLQVFELWEKVKRGDSLPLPISWQYYPNK